MKNYTPSDGEAGDGPGRLDGPGGLSDPAVLSISEVSRRTGIPVAGLRNWEQRYGLPRPQRSASGQRRYRESDCVLLAGVLRGRAGGLSLPAAMAQAVAGAGGIAGVGLVGYLVAVGAPTTTAIPAVSAVRTVTTVITVGDDGAVSKTTTTTLAPGTATAGTAASAVAVTGGSTVIKKP